MWDPVQNHQCRIFLFWRSYALGCKEIGRVAYLWGLILETCYNSSTLYFRHDTIKRNVTSKYVWVKIFIDASILGRQCNIYLLE